MRIVHVLEVICDRGEAVRDRWSVGSGYLVDDRIVLTAAHVVDGAVEVWVRRGGGTEYDARVLLTTPVQVDFALLEVAAAMPVEYRPKYGVVLRDIPGRISGSLAVGFPRFKEVQRAGRRVRDSVQVEGYIPTAEGLVSGYLTLRVDAHPRPVEGVAAESAWAGMSGAAVFVAGGVLVGVVSEHHLAEGEASLTVAPFNRLALVDEAPRRRFWELLHVADPAELVTLEPETGAPTLRTDGVVALPAALSDFTGRQGELDLVVDLVSGPGARNRAVVVWGQPGVGKSQLAVQVAHQLVGMGCDGACHIDLQGYSENRVSAEQAAARILEVLAPARGVPGAPEARYAACREVLRSGSYVVVLDNASTSAQVRELLPGPCESVVLVTSRSSLATLDARLVELDVLDTASGVALLRVMTGRNGADGEFAELVRICGHLPLALRIAGALLRARPTWDIGRLTARLADENRRLSLLQRDDLAVRPVFESSHALLGSAARELFALLGSVATVRIAPWMAAVLVDTDLAEAEELLEQLLDAQLLRPSDTDTTGTLRYTFHDLVRLYAREKLQSEIPAAALAKAEERMLSAYLAVTLMYTDKHAISGNFDFARTVPTPWSVPAEDVSRPADPMEWLLEERADIVAEIEHAYTHGHWRYVWGLADILHAVFILSSHGPESRRVKELALAAARTAGDADAELEVRFSFNSLLHYEGQYEEAVAELVEQREARRARGEDRRVSHLDLIMGVVQRDGGMLRAAKESLLRSISEFERLDEHSDPALTAMIASAQQNLAVVLREQGRLREADDLLAQCLETFERLDDAIAFGRGLHTRGVLNFYLGCYDVAESMILRSYELVRAVGDRKWTAILLLAQARLADRRCDWPSAFRLFDECDQLFRAIADPTGIAQVQRSRAVALRRSGRYEEAEAMFSLAHDGLKAVRDRRSHARLHYSEALLAIARTEWETALDRLEQSEQLLTVEDDAVWRCRVRVARSRVPDQEMTGLRAEVDALAELAGDGYEPLWVAEARRRLDARSEG